MLNLKISNTIKSLKNKAKLLLDNILNPSIAYGLDKLTNEYSGYAFKVRRSSDDATQDIGFIGINLDIYSLLLFCDGGDGFIDTLYDQSGNELNLTQSDTTKQPKIVDSGVFLGGIRYENVTPKAFLDGGTIFNQISEFSLYTNLENQTSSNGRIFDKGNKLWWLSNTNALSLWQDGGSTGYWNSSTNLNNDQQYDILTTFSGVTASSPKMYTDGNELTVNENTSFTSPVTDDSANDFIVGNRTAGDRAFIGLLNRLVLYPRVLSSEEREILFNNTYVKANAEMQPTILLIFDDGGQSVYDTVFPYLSGKDIKITTAPVHDWIGTTGIYNGNRDFMSLANLQSIYAAGHDIVSHSYTHTDFTTLTESQILTDIENMQDYLNNNSMPRGKDFLIVPFNKTSEDYYSAAATAGIKMARAGDVKNLNPDIENYLNCGYLYSPGQAATVQDMQDMVDEIIKYNIQATIMLHYVETTPTDNVEISTAAFQGLIDYLVTKSDDVRTMTMSEWYNENVGD